MKSRLIERDDMNHEKRYLGNETDDIVIPGNPDIVEARDDTLQVRARMAEETLDSLLARLDAVKTTTAEEIAAVEGMVTVEEPSVVFEQPVPAWSIPEQPVWVEAPVLEQPIPEEHPIEELAAESFLYEEPAENVEEVFLEDFDEDSEEEDLLREMRFEDLELFDPAPSAVVPTPAPAAPAPQAVEPTVAPAAYTEQVIEPAVTPDVYTEQVVEPAIAPAAVAPQAVEPAITPAAPAPQTVVQTSSAVAQVAPARPPQPAGTATPVPRNNRVRFGAEPVLPYSIEEAINRLRINISFLGTDVRKIMVVSSEPNEGKSFVALNLWKQMAVAGEPTILVDLDMRKSVFTSKYQLKREDGQELKGTSHFLSGVEPIENMILHTKYQYGDILPNVDNIVNPSMLLESNKFSEMMQYMGEHYRYAFIDTPPLGLVSDGELVGSFCDGAVLCVRGGVTSRSIIRRSIQQLERAGCPVLGIVLNRVGGAGSTYYHKYYGKKYYYKDSYYSQKG